MNKLTIKEKAKRYDEAIEKLRSLHDNYDTVSTRIDVKEELERIFPALKESEDERIRKAIIEGFERYNSGALFNGVLVKEILAWLKKQGKQPKVDSTVYSYITPNLKFFQWIYNRLVYIHHENPDVDYMVSLKERIEDMQNTIWSEEDEVCANIILRELEQDKKDSPDYARLINWFTTRFKSLRPQNTC